MKIKTINIIIILLLLLGSLLCLRCPRTVPLHKCSEVYQRYVGHEGIAAAYIQDFPVNDTLTIAVTLLEATDSAGWEYLLQAFNVSKDMRQETTASPEAYGVWVRVAPKGHPEEKVKNVSPSSSEPILELVTISYNTRMIGIFHTDNREELDAVYDYNYDYMTKKSNHLLNK